VSGGVSRRRRTLTLLGVSFLVTGLALLAYVGWQLIGTNVVSAHKQHQLVEQLRDQWRTAPVPEGDEPDPHASLSATALVRIPRFGDDYVMPVLEGTTDEDLASGLGHFEGSSDPGEVGNYALAGHRVTHGEPLRDMPSLQPGDRVLVETRDAVFTYVIDTDPDNLVVGFDDVWVVSPHPVNPDPDGVQPADDQRLLTLTTCAELFHTDDRMVVFGHLVDRKEK
jgi:sortase A